MKKNELLDCNKHESYLRKNNRSPESARPDITHNSLLKLMDSPLNRHTLLQVSNFDFSINNNNMRMISIEKS